MTGGLFKVEVGAVLAGLLMAWLVLATHNPDAIALPIAAAFVLGMVIWITWQDVTTFTIPDGALTVVGLVGAAARLVLATDGPVDAVMVIAMDACLCGGALWATREVYFRLKGVDGLGFGDVKLAAVCGILVGTMGFAWALFLASAAGLVAVLGLSFFAPQKKIDRLPFGAFLAPICWALWMLGW